MIILVVHVSGFMVIYDHDEGSGVSGKLTRLAMDFDIFRFDGKTIGFNLGYVFVLGKLFLTQVRNPLFLFL